MRLVFPDKTAFRALTENAATTALLELPAPMELPDIKENEDCPALQEHLDTVEMTDFPEFLEFRERKDFEVTTVYPVWMDSLDWTVDRDHLARWGLPRLGYPHHPDPLDSTDTPEKKATLERTEQRVRLP